jgi:hypothetical protein
MGLGLGTRLQKSRQEVTYRVRMNAVAKDNIQQEHSRRRVLRCLTNPRTP